MLGSDLARTIARFRVWTACSLVLLGGGIPSPVLGVDLLFDFEGDAGSTATDKLTLDGSQNGRLVNNVSIQADGAPFGDGAARFDIPVSGPEGFHRIRLPGTTGLGAAFTVAANVDYENTGFTRLFTSYRGTGGVGTDRIIVDFDPSGGVIPGIRAIINNTVLQTAAPPAALSDPGYHHIAVTYDDGATTIWLDGVEVVAGTLGSGAITMTEDLYFGEDPHDGGGTANEQFAGNVDDVLVLTRALDAAAIADVAANGVDGSGLAPGEGLAVWYGFDADEGEVFMDLFDADGAQDGEAINSVQVDDDAANAAFGMGSATLAAFVGFSAIDVEPLGNLGDSVTLAAVVNVPGGGHSAGGLTRLFSTFPGGGGIAGRLILDFDPNASVEGIGVRLILPNGVVAVANETFSVDEPHHIAATYDAGMAKVYLDGVEVASAEGAGDVDLGEFPLRIGEDLAGGVNENLIGTVDDVLILSRALSAQEIADIASAGASQLTGAKPFQIWYDFEGDDGIEDRLVADGAQNGTVVGNVGVTADGLHFGEQEALFEIPPVAPEGFHRIRMPGTADLGTTFTLAASVDYDNTGFTRLFTSYRGTGSVAERIILDFDPSGAVIPGLRAIINNTILQTDSPPAALSEPGYHHVALTYDDGATTLWLDGAQVAEGSLGSGAVSMGQDVFFGEDPHDGGGSANEQFVGNVDDIVLLSRALDPASIERLAMNGVDGAGFTPGAGLAIWYSFDGDTNGVFADLFSADGAQDGEAINSVQIDGDAANAAFGAGSAALSPFAGFSAIDVGSVGSLGSAFTLSASINVPGGGHSAGGLTRLFSTFSGGGSAAGRLIFDFDPNASVEGIGMRLLLPDGTAVIADIQFDVNATHTLTATYDAGDVRLYFNGFGVASGSTAGDVDLGEFPLRIGEDTAGAANENFIGTMDDVLILSRALSPESVERLAMAGAAAVATDDPSDNARPTAVIATEPDPPVVQLSNGEASVVLDGSDSDDGDGGVQGLTFLWEKTSGPEGDVIVNETASFTEVTLVSPGEYEYALTVDDGQPENARASATIAVTVLTEPVPVDILYDFEGDEGDLATDKLSGDGAIDGILQNNVSIVAEKGVPFGNQAARFAPPDQFSTIEIPDTLELGAAWTIAAHVNYENEGFTRLFTSFRGTGAVGEDRIILDFDPSGGVIPGLRAIVNNIVVQTSEAPAGLADPGYHHVALRYDDGDVTIFLDGEPVADGAAGSGPITMSANLRFGEDPHDGGGAANEQFLGTVDEILVLGRALGDIDISTLAAAGVRANLERADTLGVHYSFEPDDAGGMITDRFVMDGEQNGIVHGDVVVDDAEGSAFDGEQAGRLSALGAPLSVIDIGPLGNVGPALTMAAVVNVPDGGFSARGLTRLFSSFAGTGSPAGRLIFDFNPDADVEGIGLRTILPNGTSVVSDRSFSVNEPHHLAMTYDDGLVTLYLDGEAVASAQGAGGNLDFGDAPLRFGEDLGGAANENIEGLVDDVLVTTELLDDVDIVDLADLGANAFFGISLPNNAPTAVVTTDPDPAEVTLVGGAAEIVLDGGSSDDGDGGAQGLTFSWEKVEGPAGDTIDAPEGEMTAVSFTQAGDYVYRLTVDDAQAVANTDSAMVKVSVLEDPAPQFIRSDANGDGKVNITDGIFVLNFLFLGGPAPPCTDAADSDDSAALNLTDGIFTLNFLFLGGPAPPAPFPDCGLDETADDFAMCAPPAVCDG